MSPFRRTTAALAAAMTVLLSAGCVSLPDQGAVRTAPSAQELPGGNVPFFSPPPPTPGHAPTQIVSGFLRALEANPLSTSVARQYLTRDAATRWNPNQGTLIYAGTSSTESESGRAVELRLSDTDRLDARGSWLGPTPGGEVAFDLEMVREDGEWRIGNPPDVLTIPDSYFDTRFDQYSLYFFDPSAQVLVPEPVYIPRGDQAATLLTRGLLRGPEPAMADSLRSFFPRETDVDLSVPVSRAGVVEVPLSGAALDLPADDLNRMTMQLAWTLRQVPGVERLRVTVNDTSITLPGGDSEVAVTVGSEFDPAIVWASAAGFGLREGRLVEFAEDDESPVSGTFGTEDQTARSVGVDLAGGQAALVAEDGTSVRLGPVDRRQGSQAAAADARTVYNGGRDVLKPAWDMYGTLWLVDRFPGGAVVSAVTSEGVQTVRVPGITAQDVRAFLVSRDGSRLVALLREDDGPGRVLVSRLVRDGVGGVRSAIRATDLASVDTEVVGTLVDLGWSSPTTLAALADRGDGISAVTGLSIDGSPGTGGITATPDVFRSETAAVITSPVVQTPLLLQTVSGQLFELATTGRWQGSGLETGLLSPTYVG